jgi:uncharacterized membrane protein
VAVGERGKSPRLDLASSGMNRRDSRSTLGVDPQQPLQPGCHAANRAAPASTKGDQVVVAECPDPVPVEREQEQEQEQAGQQAEHPRRREVPGQSPDPASEVRWRRPNRSHHADTPGVANHNKITSINLSSRALNAYS